MSLRLLLPIAVASAFAARPDANGGTRPGSLRDSGREIVRNAQRAVEGDSVAPVRGRWEARLGRDPGDRASRLGLATIARRMFDYDRADREYAEVLRQSPLPDDIALRARLGAAHVEQDHRSFARAATMFRQAWVAARGAGDTDAQVEAVVGISNGLALSAGPHAARMLLDSVRDLVPAVPGALAGEYHCVRGLQRFFEGGTDADQEELRGLFLARQGGSRQVEGVCLCYLGARRMTSGDIAGAFASFDSAERVQRAARDRWNLAATFVWRGFLDTQLYNHGAALRDVTAALEEADRSGAVVLRAWALRNLAQVEWHTSDLVSASTHLAQATTLMKASGDDRGVAAVRVIMGGVALDRGDADVAERYFREDLVEQSGAGMALLAFDDQQALAQVAMRRGDWVAAAGAMREVATYGRRHALAGWVAGLEYDLGVIALHRRDYRSAEHFFDSYLSGRSKDRRIDRYSARARLAEVFLARGEAGRAAAELTAATDELDALRAGLDETGLRVMIFQTHRGYDDPDVGFATVIAGLVRAGDVGAAFELAERRRARQLADEMALARSLRLGAAPSSPTAPMSRSDPGLGLDSIRAAIPDDRTAVIEFVVGGSGQPTTVFALSRSGVHGFAAPPIDTLRSAIERFTAAIRDGRDTPLLATELRRALMDSALAALPATITRLIVVPDGALHTLPLDALALDDGRPVVARYAIADVPSFAIARALWQRPQAVTPASILALGDPDFTPIPSARADGAAAAYTDAFTREGGLPRLAGSAREARLAARYSDRGEVRLRADASEAWFKHADLEPFQVIHLATHAVVDERSAMRTALALAPGGGEDGFLGPGELAALRLRADLVVLSACRTAGGQIVGGEGVQGLTGPLLEAGAGSVLATLWPVGDQSTLAMIDAFYRGLAHGLDVLDALRGAKLDAMSRGAPTAQWAGFVLVGNPSARVALREPAASRLWLVALLLLIPVGVLVVRRAARR